MLYAGQDLDGEPLCHLGSSAVRARGYFTVGIRDPEALPCGCAQHLIVPLPCASSRGAARRVLFVSPAYGQQ